MEVNVDQGDLQTEKDLWTAALVILLTSAEPPLPRVRQRDDKQALQKWLGFSKGRARR